MFKRVPARDEKKPYSRNIEIETPKPGESTSGVNTTYTSVVNFKGIESRSKGVSQAPKDFQIYREEFSRETGKFREPSSDALWDNKANNGNYERESFKRKSNDQSGKSRGRMIQNKMSNEELEVKTRRKKVLN